VDWLGLTSELGKCWYLLAGHIAWHVHSHHKCWRLRCFILRNYMYYDTGHFITYGNCGGLVTFRSGLAWKFVSPALSSPPSPPKTGNLQYNQNNSKSCPYSLVSDYNLQHLPEAWRIKIMRQRIFTLDWFCVQTLLPPSLTWPQSEWSLLSEICIAYLKPTSGRQLNAHSFAMHKVSSD